MNKWQLFYRSVYYYRKLLQPTAVGIALTAMVITGTLIVGDSVQTTLRNLAAYRLGKVEQALISKERWFRISVAKELHKVFKQRYASVISIPAYAAATHNGINLSISLYGIDSDFFSLAPRIRRRDYTVNPGEVLLNRTAARGLGAKTGDFIVVRYLPLQQMPGDAPMSRKDFSSVGTRLKVAGIIENQDFGDFNPQNTQALRPNLLVNINYLANILKRPGKANMIITDSRGDLIREIKPYLKLSDYGLSLKRIEDSWELTSNRIFISEEVDQAAQKLYQPQKRLLGYFINTISSSQKTTFYSFAVGIDGHPVSSDLKKNEVLINRWLADQIGAEAGSELTLSAYKLDQQGSLYEESWNVVVQSVVPMVKPFIGSGMTPSFPGIHDAENCTDWKPGVPIDLDRISVQDELYWKKYKASPKIFLPLNKAQSIWGNRFVSLTAIRFQSGQREAIVNQLLDHISPGQLGLTVYPLRREAMKGVAESVDFKGLTLGLSLFIIVAALILSRQLFTFYLEQRVDQFAILKSFGFNHLSIWAQFALEGSLCSIVATVIGSMAGVLFGGVIIIGFNTIWQAAVNNSQLEISFQWTSLLIGAVSTFIIVMIALTHCIYKFINTSSRSMLNKESKTRPLNRKKLLIRAIFFLCLSIPFVKWGIEGENQEAIFFGVGFLILISTLYWSAWLLAILPHNSNRLSFTSLAWRNCVRRPQRSITVIAALALAVFLCLTVTANRKGMVNDPYQKSSGTGGFSLYVETAFPIKGNLDSTIIREDNKIERLFSKTALFPLPSVEGSEASCLNLNRVTRPHISGIDSKDFAGRFAFKKTMPGLDKDWEVLNYDFREPAVIPAVADMDVITWILGKKLGDDLEYQGSNGEIIRLRLVGGLESSIFQGRVLISKDNFYRLFPDSSGYQLFLVDSPPRETVATKKTVRQAFRFHGPHVEDTRQRLHRFNAVQNTYLAVFLALGAVGLALGCFGLAVLIRRNFIERLDENTCLLAIGYSGKNIKRMFFHEHLLLFILAVASGIISSLAALIPALLSDTAKIPLLEMVVFTIVVVVFGVGSLFFATRKDITLDLQLLSQVEE